MKRSDWGVEEVEEVEAAGGGKTGKDNVVHPN
jgi:hypothetical protein